MAPSLLLAAFAAVAAAAPGPAAAPASSLRRELMAAAEKARTAFLAGAPIGTALPEAELSRLESLPELQQAEGKKWDGVAALESYKELTAALAEATRVQDQGLSPEGPKGPEKLKPLLVKALAMTPAETAGAETLYRRPAGAPSTPQDRARMEEEKKKLEAAMANPRLPAGERSRLGARMNRVAAQLRWDPGDGGGEPVLAAFGSGAAGPLTRADFQRLNAANGAPGPNSLRTGAVPMPSGSPFDARARRAAERTEKARSAQESRRQTVLNDAQRESQTVDGLASDAYRYWDDLDKSSGWLGKGTAKTMKGLLTLSGLTAVERAAARAGYVSGSDDVTAWDQTTANGALAGNIALSAVNFLPAVGIAGRVANGERALTLLSRGGTAVRGVAPAAPEAATAIRSVGGQIDDAIRASIPAGAKPAPAQLEALVGRLNDTGKAYGVEVRIGGVVGESQSVGGVVTASLAKGAPHEVTHVTQQVYNNIAALERAASRQGVAVGALAPQARAAAFAEARAMEQAGYLQHEAQAFYATGFGGGGRVQYADRLRESVGHLAQSNVAGTVVGGQYGKAATAYGMTGALLGDSQKLLFTNGYWASANILYPALNGATTAGLDYLLDAGAAPPPPARPKKR